MASYRKTYEVDYGFMKSLRKQKKKLKHLFDRKEEVVKLEEVDELWHRHSEKPLQVSTYNDMSGDEPTYPGQKIEECIPRDDTDIDTNQSFKNYEDSDWSKDEYEWLKNENGTNISK